MLLTSSTSLAQLLVLNESSKHLSFHEKLQELPDATGRVGFAETVTLELSASIGRLHQVEGIVAHQFHEEPHESLGHQ